MLLSAPCFALRATSSGAADAFAAHPWRPARCRRAPAPLSLHARMYTVAPKCGAALWRVCSCAAASRTAALCRRAASTLAVLGRSRDLTSLAGPRARSMGRTRALRGALMCCTDAASPLLRTTGASGAAAGRPSTLQALEHALVLALSRPGFARSSRTRCPRFLSTTLIVPVSSAGGYIRVRPD